MGTNYYHRTNICHCCGRYDQQHICKSLISFEAVLDWPDEPPWAPVVVVGSWQRWRGRLLAQGEVWDEYGHPHDTAKFIEQVEGTDAESRARQHEWMVAHEPARVSLEPAPGYDWLDADGFSFYGGEFS